MKKNNKLNKNTYLFIGGILDGERIKVPHYLEIYRHESGDYFIETIRLNSAQKDDFYVYFYLYEGLKYNEGIRMLMENYRK